MTATREHLAGLELAKEALANLPVTGLTSAKNALDQLIKEAQSAPEPVQNQCDGCNAGVPLVDGMHRMGKPGGYSDPMRCQAAKYAPEPVQGEVALGSEQILEIFERNGFCIELGASFSARGQIAQLLNAVGEIERTAAAKPDWRVHSVNYAKGEKCPETIETLQAAWDRDQELINDMRHEIARHKTRINRLEQRRTAKPDAELVELLQDATELIKRGDFDTGYCCCGGAVDKHGFGDGHSPVDEGGYCAIQMAARIDAKLASLK